MIRTSADYGPVPTARLVDLVARKIAAGHDELDRLRLPQGTRDRAHRRLDLIYNRIMGAYVKVTAGQADEQVFRARLVALMAPEAGANTWRFRFRRM